MIARSSVAAVMSTRTCSIIRLVRAYGDGGSSGSSSVTSKPASESGDEPGLVAYSEADEENSTRFLPSAVSSSKSSSDLATLSL